MFFLSICAFSKTLSYKTQRGLVLKIALNFEEFKNTTYSS